MSRSLSDPINLGRLDPDPAKAEDLCQEIRDLLIRFFEYRNHENPEDLAHEALLRGLAKLGDGAEVHVPMRYFFFGIAKNVSLEQQRVRTHESIGSIDEPTAEAAYQGLTVDEMRILYQQCLSNLSPRERQDLLDYLEGDEGDPLVTPVARRTRVHRIRKKLWAMILPCEKKVDEPATTTPRNAINIRTERNGRR